MQLSSEWIECMSVSPDGRYLAVGSHDNYIYILENNEKKYTLKGHNSFIVCLDWSIDGKYLRSNCGAHEVLYWAANDSMGFLQDKNGRSNTRGVTWATKHTKFGWCVEGIFPVGCDGTHINGVDGSHDGMLVATGDDFGLVNIFRDPCRNGSKPLSLRGHSEHVVRVAFSPDDQYLFSVGGYDQTLM
jgi:microtubule-associated protein-like 1/2